MVLKLNTLALNKERMDVKTAIQNGDAAALRQLLAEDSSRANELIVWGEKPCYTHRFQFISDMLFGGALPSGKEIPLVDVLLDAGADLDFQRSREDGRKGDTPLIGAASLGAEELGLRLLAAGANPNLRGLFAETALHWAALLCEDRLLAELIRGSNVNLRDKKYSALGMGAPWVVRSTRRKPRPATRGGRSAGRFGSECRTGVAGTGEGARRSRHARCVGPPIEGKRRRHWLALRPETPIGNRYETRWRAR